ncbi:MAG: WD40/YVTN/BNR-like repeat-containing protein [Chloroflexota bacterium]
MTWQQIGQLEGGTVGALAVVTSSDGQPAVYAMSPAGGFAYRPGHPWQTLSPLPGPPLNDVLVASPAFERDGTLFAGGRTGVYRSEDRGQTWQHLLQGEVLSIAVSPAFADDHTLFVGTGQDGVLRSDDGGVSWSGANSGLLDLTALAVAFSPHFSQDRTAFVGTASALYRSRNGGRSWREVPLGMAEPAIQALAISPHSGEKRLMLAGTEAHGLLRSTDGGARFTDIPAFEERGISALTISQDGGTVIAAAGSEILRSDDGGQTWTELPEAPGLVLALALLPGEGEPVLLAGLHRVGAACLDFAGGRWTPVNDGLHASLVTSVTFSPAFAADRTIFALSLEDGLLLSEDGGQTFRRCWPEDADPSIAALAVAGGSAGALTLLASTTDRLYRSVDSALSWQALTSDTAPPLDIVIALPPGGPGQCMIGAGSVSDDGRQRAGIVLSEDGGQTWRPLGAIGANEAGWSFQVGALAVSPSYWQDRTVLARSLESRADGQSLSRLWRSTDGGQSWVVWQEDAGADGPMLPGTLIQPPGLPGASSVVMATVDRVLTPVAGAWERHGGQRRPVWHAADFGPAVASVTVLAAPPVTRSGSAASRTIYAGTNAGPYVSRDGGQSFRPWVQGYGGGGVVALAVSPDFAADHMVLAVSIGGALWQIQDQ